MLLCVTACWALCVVLLLLLLLVEDAIGCADEVDVDDVDEETLNEVDEAAGGELDVVTCCCGGLENERDTDVLTEVCVVDGCCCCCCCLSCLNVASVTRGAAVVGVDCCGERVNPLPVLPSVTSGLPLVIAAASLAISGPTSSSGSGATNAGCFCACTAGCLNVCVRVAAGTRGCVGGGCTATGRGVSTGTATSA